MFSKDQKGGLKFITTGHTMSGKLNFPRRVYTSYLNSAIYQTFNHFSANIKESFEKMEIDAPIYILKADGGTTTDIFFLVDGIPLFEPLGIQIGSCKTLVRSIYSVSIGLGGDSQIKLEKGRSVLRSNQ